MCPSGSSVEAEDVTLNIKVKAIKVKSFMCHKLLILAEGELFTGTGERNGKPIKVDTLLLAVKGSGG